MYCIIRSDWNFTRKLVLKFVKPRERVENKFAKTIPFLFKTHTRIVTRDNYLSVIGIYYKKNFLLVKSNRFILHEIL